MTEENNLKQSQKDAAPEQNETADKIIESLLRDDPAQALEAIDQSLGSLDANSVDPEERKLSKVLPPLRSFLQGYSLLIRNTGYKEARDLFMPSAQDFGHLGQDELKHLALGFGTYAEGILQIRGMNIALAQDSLAKAKAHLQKIGKFRSIFDPVIDNMECEGLYIGAWLSLAKLDYPMAEILFEKAAVAQEDVATKHFEAGTPEFCFTLGTAHFYRAFSTFSLSYNELNHLSCDEDVFKQDLSSDAVKAQTLFLEASKGSGSDSNKPSGVLGQRIHMSGAVANLLEAIALLALSMNKILRSTFKPNIETFRHMRTKIREANRLFVKAGDDAVTLVKFCEELAERVNNIERIAKPTKKDFGIYSGLVSCALFLVLFLATSGANALFKLGVEPKFIIWSCVALGLIGGFGYGALKFRPLFSATNGKTVGNV